MTAPIKQLYSNKATATVANSGGITSSATSLQPSTISGFPDATLGQFTIGIDSELILVTAYSSPNWTIARAQEGTSGASHAEGATIFHPLTGVSLGNLNRQLHSGTAVSQRRDLNFVDTGGIAFTLTDDPTNAKVDISAAGGGYESAFTKPLIADGWTWVNQLTATRTDAGNGLALYVPSSATHGPRGLYRTLPSGTSYTAIFRFLPVGFLGLKYGPFLYDTVSGKTQYFPFQLVSNVWGFAEETGSSFTGTANVTSFNISATFINWVKIVESSGGGRKVYLSNDGITWILSYSLAAGNFVVPTSVGFAVNDDTNSVDAVCTLLSFSMSSP